MKGIYTLLSACLFYGVTIGLPGCSPIQTRGEITGTLSYVSDSTATVVTVYAIDDLSVTISVDTLPPRPIPPNPPIPFVLRCNVPGQYRIRLNGIDSEGNPWQAYYRSPGGISMSLPDATPIVLDAMNPIRSGVDIEIPARP